MNEILNSIPVDSIFIDYDGAFPNSKLQSVPKELILTHFVEISQIKGEWIYELTLIQFFSTFELKMPPFTSLNNVLDYIEEMNYDGYIRFKGKDSICLTEKFVELCKDYL